MSKLIVDKVNRFDSNWSAETLFKGFNIRATLKHHDDMITKITAMSRLRRRMTREMGQEGDEWIIINNEITDRDELYLKNSGKLVMWKLQDNVAFDELFDNVEQHQENIDEIREDQD